MATADHALSEQLVQQAGILRIQDHVGAYPFILKGAHDQIIAASAVTPPREHQRRFPQFLNAVDRASGGEPRPYTATNSLPRQREHGVVGVLHPEAGPARSQYSAPACAVRGTGCP